MKGRRSLQPVLEAHSPRAFTARRFALTRDSTYRPALHSGRPVLFIFIVVMEAIQADAAMEEFFGTVLGKRTAAQASGGELEADRVTKTGKPNAGGKGRGIQKGGGGGADVDSNAPTTLEKVREARAMRGQRHSSRWPEPLCIRTRRLQLSDRAQVGSGGFVFRSPPRSLP